MAPTPKVNCQPIGVEVPSKKENITHHPIAQEIANVTGLEEAKKTGGILPQIKTGWTDEAFVKGQFQDESNWEYDEVVVELFDLSKTKDLKNYSKIVQDSFKEDPNVVIIDEQKQFCNNSENWKILIQIAKIKYKKVLNETDEKESD